MGCSAASALNVCRRNGDPLTREASAGSLRVLHDKSVARRTGITGVPRLCMITQAASSAMAIRTSLIGWR
jgi:hypothetical protein